MSDEPVTRLFCSWSPRWRDGRRPALLHHPLLHPGPRGAGRHRTHGLQPLEREQTQAFLLIPEQSVYRCFTGCVCQSVSDTTEELKHTTRGREGELNGFEAQSQENKRSHSCDIYIFCCCYGRSICFSQIFMLKFVHLNLKHNGDALQHLHWWKRCRFVVKLVCDHLTINDRCCF